MTTAASPGSPLALELQGDASALPMLQRYADDPYQIEGQYVVRGFAALALGMIGDPAGIPALVRLAGDDDPVVRWHAAVTPTACPPSKR
jgi:HEAT repeat protein